MAYKALYRAYRPQTFEEVAGQQHIVRTLKNALESGKIAHAYLFCGPRGTGKTTMAKIFAKALNCEQGVGHTCNECSNCREVIEGSHPDVIEIDAASNNGVEQVRDLIEKVNYLPIKGKYKVYIIDEVHMMTTAAFNALLKTIEEPPAHVVFILATTEPHNIIPTILSRCQRYDFTKVSDADIEERMAVILEKEQVTYDKEAVRAIISLADGGMRDALSILDQILAYSGNTLSEDDVYSLFGLAGKDEKINFIKFINNGDVSKALSKINAFVEGGIDIKRFTQDLLEILKDVLIYKKTTSEDVLVAINEEEAVDLSSCLTIHKLNKMIGAFLTALSDYKTANNVKTLFEVVVLRLCTEDDNTQIENIVEKKVEKKTEPKVSQESQPIIEQPKPVEEVKAEEKPVVAAPDWLFDEDTEKKNVELDGEKYSFDEQMLINLTVIGDKTARKELTARWKELDSYLAHPTLGDVVALLKDGKPFLVTKDIVVLEYDFDKLAQKANVINNSNRIASILTKMLDHEVFAYAISASERVRLITSYHNLLQINQLPKPNSIHIDIKELKK